jgi:hypothetical protein
MTLSSLLLCKPRSRRHVCKDAARCHGGAGEDEGDAIAGGGAGSDEVEVGEGRVAVGGPKGHELPQGVAQPEGSAPAAHRHNHTDTHPQTHMRQSQTRAHGHKD